MTPLPPNDAAASPFNDLELLLRYAQGGGTAEERAQVEAAMVAEPRLAQRIATMRAARWDAQHQLERLWQTVHDAVAATTASRPAVRQMRRPWWGEILLKQTLRGRPDWSRWTLGMGAWMSIVAVAVVLMYSVAVMGRPTVAKHDHVYATAIGQLSSLTLTDGSHVVLSPQSKLIVDATFGSTTRTLTLTGEAYFDVPAGSVPFIIRTGVITTRVLGTRFVVTHRGEDSTVRVAVLSGKVAIQNRRTVTTLAARNGGQFTDSTVVTTSADLNTSAAWTHGQLVFKDEPLATVLVTLGRWYGYDFQLSDSSMAADRVSVILDAKAPSEAMMVLQRLLHVTMTFNRHTVVLHPQVRRTSVPVRDQHPFSPSTVGVGK